MQQRSNSNWTQGVLIALTAGVVLAAVVWVIAPQLRRDRRPLPIDSNPRRDAPAEVQLWVGEIAPELRGMLTSVFGDEGPDREHAAELSARIGLPESEPLGFYRLLLFNTGKAAKTVSIEDGMIRIRLEGTDAASTVPLRRLSGVLEERQLDLTGGLRFSLDALGALRDEVTVQAGTMANLLVAFSRQVPLTQVAAVETGDGKAFVRRPISRGRLRQMMADPQQEMLEGY